jgi:hypothetical protein
LSGELRKKTGLFQDEAQTRRIRQTVPDTLFVNKDVPALRDNIATDTFEELRLAASISANDSVNKAPVELGITVHQHLDVSITLTNIDHFNVWHRFFLPRPSLRLYYPLLH